jgi:hypothetical protein
MNFSKEKYLWLLSRIPLENYLDYISNFIYPVFLKQRNNLRKNSFIASGCVFILVLFSINGNFFLSLLISAILGHFMYERFFRLYFRYRSVWSGDNDDLKSESAFLIFLEDAYLDKSLGFDVWNNLPFYIKKNLM